MRCLLLLLLFLKESSSFEARWDGDMYGKGHVKYVGSARMSIDLRKEFIALRKFMFLIQYEHCCGFISTMCCFCSTYSAFSSSLTRHACPNADTSIRPDGARTQT